MGRPTGTVTFLFTDIEGSTRRWEEQTAEMREALAQHDATLRSAVESHNGWLFKHTGDGILAAFASPKEAVLAAIDAQRALSLPVRMGITTGEAESRGHDYFGPALNRAARIMAAGHGGQVLLAQSTASLVDGVDLLDLGEHRLRDLSRPQLLYQLRAEGLKDSFPPLRTLNEAAGNLPIQPTSLLGRDQELAGVLDGMAQHRLLTLTGTGGVGKTRLALQAAASVGPDFPGGTWLIELAAANDPGEVERLTGATAGALPPISRDSLLDFLHGKHLLLVLDNCEHVLDACAGLASAVLANCPNVWIIATSREALGVPGEWTIRVPSLRVPPEGVHDVAEVASAPAVELLIERARAVRPGFAVSERTAADIADVVRRLDGIPLAIELAAARLRMMSPAELRGHLADRFRLLTGSRRGSLERHQTLKAAIDWSFRLLSKEEQQLARRLAVFTDGWTLEAAEAVCTGRDVSEPDVLDLLTELVDKSLVQMDEGDGESPTRYRYLESIRLYMADSLDGVDERAAVEQHFLAWALDVVNSVPQRRWAHTPAHALLLLRESRNLAAAMERALDDGHADAAARLAGNSGVVIWFGTGAYDDGIRLSAAAYEAGGGSDLDRFNLGNNIALMWMWSGAIGRSIEWFDRMIALARQSNELTGTDVAPSIVTLSLIDDARRETLERECGQLAAAAAGTVEADYVAFILTFSRLLQGDSKLYVEAMHDIWQRRGEERFGPINDYLVQNLALATWIATGDGGSEAKQAVAGLRGSMNPTALIQALCLQAIIDPLSSLAALREAQSLLRYHRASGFATFFFGAAARIAARMGNREGAGRLLGAGRKWTMYSPALQPGWERVAVGDLLDDLPTAEFEALLQEGARFSFDEALDLAVPASDSE
ncbi:MAG: adenylate/guanylate cyclase domain-containing protein [Dehalococcoidia bacterium]